MSKSSLDTNTVLIVAGEASADHHAAKIVRNLKQRAPHLRILGMGGDQMIAQGFEAIAHAREVSVMGFFEVILHLPRIVRAMWRLRRAVQNHRPRVALLVDLPDFNLRFAKFLKSFGIHIIYYISPQVWAWRPARVEQIRARVDEMLCVLPFEERFYLQRHVPARYVGHPLVEDFLAQPPVDSLSAPILKNEKRVFALLPGSRAQESGRLLPTMLQAAQAVAMEDQDVHFVIPLAGATTLAWVQSHVEKYPALTGRLTILPAGAAQQVLRYAKGAIVASGTATLEAALWGVPYVGIYKMSPLSFWIAKRLVKVQTILLANWILGHNWVQELIQNEVTRDNLQRWMKAFLNDEALTQKALQIQSKLLETLTRAPATITVSDLLLTAHSRAIHKDQNNVASDR